MVDGKAGRGVFWTLGVCVVLLFLVIGGPAAGERDPSTLPAIWWQLADLLPAVGPLSAAWVLAALTAVLAIGFGVGLWCALAGSGWPSSVRELPALPHRRSLCDSAPSSAPAARFARATVTRNRLWAAASLLVLFAGVVAYRVGSFTLWRTVDVAGQPTVVPDTFSAIDHPFHIARAQMLRDSLARGELTQWVANHQGGYPVEFYPLGVPWLEVGLWAVGGGLLPIASVHKIFVTLVFLAPGAWFWCFARRDRSLPSVAVLAFTFHVFVPAGPWQGGYTELVQMGLVTNVTASVALLGVLLGVTAYLERGRAQAGAGAAVLAALAVFCNPRSIVGLGAIGVAAVLACRVLPARRRPAWWTLLARLGGVGALALLLAAPELVPLTRFRDLYEFIRYTWYESPSEYVYALFEAVSVPVAIAGLAGVVFACQWPAGRVVRTVAATWIIYTLCTLLASSGLGPLLVPQLEATRLMPLQRLLTMYLAAFAVVSIVQRWTAWATPRSRWAPDLLMLALSACLFVFVAAPTATGLTIGPLYAVETSATVETLEFAKAVEQARAATSDATATLLVGSGLSTHQQLWAPMFAPGRFFYDDWLWLWQPHHVGPDTPATTHGLISADAALTRTYLDLHAIGAVVVSGDAARVLASRSPDLVPIPIQNITRYDLYEVRSPTRIVTFPGASDVEVTTGNHRVTARGRTTGGDAVIRQNWFPRWRAAVNGVPVEVVRSPGTYMTVALPPGDVVLELTYTRDLLDWSSLGAGLVGCLLAIGLLTVRRRRPRSPEATRD